MSPPMRQQQRSSGRLGGLLITTVLVVGAVLVAGALGWMLLGKPFSTKTVDRSATPVLTEIRDLSEFHAAQGDFNVIVDLEKDVKYMPSALAGERTLFVGVGTVDAFVDFSTMGTNAIQISPDGKSVTVTLPRPTLQAPNLDTERSHVAARKRGLFNRIGGLFSDNPTSESELYHVAEEKLAAAAEASDLRQRAQDQTQRMLEHMLTRLGYEGVTIVFTSAPAGAGA